MEDPKPADTTLEEDRHSAGQRSINRLWEFTQAAIALAITTVALWVAAYTALRKPTADTQVQVAASVFIYGVANLVIGFYFGRTNHQRSGGVGGEYAGPR